MSSNLILRKSPRFILLKEMIENGDFGDMFYLDGDYNYGRIHKITEGWRGKLDFYSIVYGGGIHIIDLFLWLTGERIVEVSAYGNDISTRGTDFSFYDLVVCILRFESGIVGKISVNFGCMYPHFHKLSIYGTKATFENGLDYGIIYNTRDRSTSTKKVTTSYPGFAKGDHIYNYVDSILNNSQPEISQDDVFDSMSVCFAIEKATHDSGSVKVEYI